MPASALMPNFVKRFAVSQLRLISLFLVPFVIIILPIILLVKFTEKISFTEALNSFLKFNPITLLPFLPFYVALSILFFALGP